MATPVNYSELIQKKGYAYKTVESYSHYNDPIDRADDRAAGNSRIWGDASEAVQKRAIDALIKASQQAGLDTRQTAHVLAIARVESGFNPDAAAGTTSAHGLGQFINKTGAHYGIDNSNRYDLEKQADALVEHFRDNLKLAQSRGQGEAYVYKYHHDGPSSDYGGLGISKKDVAPYIDKYEQFVKAHEQQYGKAEVDQKKLNPPTRAAVKSSSVLMKGSKGDAVRDLQSKLNALYPDKTPLETKTGIFGDQTKAALEAFQKEHGLDVDGKAGKATFAKLAELLGKDKAADLPPIDLVAKSQPEVEGPATDRARLEADLVLAQAREAELQKQIADLAAKDVNKNQSPEKDFKIDLLEIANKTISLTVTATGISLNINGKDHDASCFNQLKSGTTEAESVYRNNSNTLLAKYEHGSDQFNIFQKNAYGADKVAVISDFSQQNAINLVGIEATKMQSLAQQKNVGTER